MAHLGKKAFILFLLPSILWSVGIPYSVEFEGLEDAKILKALRSASQLVALKKKSPPSINALRFRSESDASDLVRVLKAHGYLEAEISSHLEESGKEYTVILSLQPGPLYRIEQYKILCKNGDQDSNAPQLKAEEVGICLGDPADTKQILESELYALQLLSEKGYPLASISTREMIADGKTKRVQIHLTIETGPLAYFGKTSIEGNTSVKDYLIEQQIQCSEKKLYDSSLVEGTQKSLMETGLFSSVYITHPKKMEQDEYLPMKIEVSETKHKTISLGTSYQTTFGPGATLGWENRNVGGLGRKLTFQADIAQKSHSGIASYLIPNFHRIGQNYTIQAQAWHEAIKPYRMQTYNFLNRFDRQLDKNFYFSFGAKVEYLMVTNSVDNGNFVLVEGPVHLRWTNVENFLNPTAGMRIEYRGTPALNIKDVSEIYYVQNFSVSGYVPLWENEFLILAQKLTIGTIFSNGIGAVPVPKRIFGGSEDHLRGYKYYTVSPLDEEGKPIGGRSAIFYSIEPRFRVSKTIGIVPFFDIGNVYLDSVPTLRGKWRKSGGIGFRYYSFLGPMRLDLAFPMDRREDIDPHWWILVSLGQAF